MVQSSFFSDTPNYATDYPAQNDTPPANGNPSAPSSFYPDGGVYEQADPDAAFNYATQAAASAASAASHDASSATHDTNSAASAAAALASQNAAATSETNAAASAASAASHDTSAGTHDTSAAASAASAATSETNAATSATNAAANAANAYTNATSAQGSATAAATSATNAANSATSAATSAANAATTVANALNNAALTGVPTAPTPTSGDNSTKVATTAFVETAIAPLVGPMIYKGTWNAATNTPTLTSGSGTKGWLYKVSVAGTTAIDGISQWNVGDGIIFDGTVWDKIDGLSSEVVSVAGRTGAVVLTVADVSGAAPSASPALTGAPTAPTAASTDNSTKLATTAYVQNVLVSYEKTSALTTTLGAYALLASPAFTGAPTAPTASLGTNTTQIATCAFVLANRGSGSSVLRSYLAGLTLSSSGPSTSFGIAAGVATDSSNTVSMALASAITKTTGAWVAGTGNGALDTGTIVANAWYWVFLIENGTTSAVDVCITKSVAATTPSPTLPSGYTNYRYIGSMKTNGSSQWIPFIQIGDLFQWMTPIGDISSVTLGNSSPTSLTLSVPLGVNVEVRFNCLLANTASDAGVLFYSPLTVAQADNSPSGNISMLSQQASNDMADGPILIMTNTSGQIAAISNASTGNAVSLATIGWTDCRFRDN